MIKILILALIIIVTACEEETINQYQDYILEPKKPSISYGCGNFFIYQYLNDSNVLTVKFVGNNSSLTKEPQTIDLANANPNAIVVLEIAGNAPDSNYFNYCNDVAVKNLGTTIKYKAISGELTFSVSEDNPLKVPRRESSYGVTVQIKNLRLYNQEKGNKIIINEIVFSNVRVGWFPG